MLAFLILVFFFVFVLFGCGLQWRLYLAYVLNLSRSNFEERCYS